MEMQRLRVFGVLAPVLALPMPPAWSGEAVIGAQPLVCKEPALARSRCLIEAALKDLAASYTSVGGGGITEIRELATNVFRISISQEGRIDRVTYEFDVKPDGTALVRKRTESTDSMDPALGARCDASQL